MKFLLFLPETFLERPSSSSPWLVRWSVRISSHWHQLSIGIRWCTPCWLNVLYQQRSQQWFLYHVESRMAKAWKFLQIGRLDWNQIQVQLLLDAFFQCFFPRCQALRLWPLFDCHQWSWFLDWWLRAQRICHFHPSLWFLLELSWRKCTSCDDRKCRQ